MDFKLSDDQELIVQAYKDYMESEPWDQYFLCLLYTSRWLLFGAVAELQSASFLDGIIQFGCCPV